MANLIAYQDGNFTGSTTFKTVATSTNATQQGDTTSSLSTVSYVHSAQFTITNGVVIEGVLLKLRRVVASPTGTFSVQLSDDGGTTATREVTINVSDLPNDVTNPTYVFFKFGSTLTGDGGADYVVSIKSSVASEVRVHTNATANNWYRLLRTNTTASIASGDWAYYCANVTAAGTKTDVTVTMDSTSSATSYGTQSIGYGGILKYGTTASTNYYLKINTNPTAFEVRPGGTFNMGTSATPVPRTSTAILECVNPSAGAATLFNYGTMTVQGQSRTSGKNVVYTTLTADAAANATSLSVADDTGWLSGDVIAVAPTTQTRTQAEAGTLNGDAGASTLTVNGFAGTGGGLLNAHGGTSPIVCHVANLTRNVMITSSSSTNTLNFTHAGAVSSFDGDWMAFRWLNTASITIPAGTSWAADYCAINVCASLNTSATSTSQTWNQSTFYNLSGNSFFTIQGTSASLTFTNLCFILTATNNVTLSSTGQTVTINNINIAGASTACVLTGTVAPGSTISNLTLYSSSVNGLNVTNTGTTVTVDTVKIFRNASIGISMAGGATTINTISSITCFGNAAAGVSVSNDGKTTLSNLTAAGDTTFAQADGIRLNATQGGVLVVRNGTLGSATGIYVAHSTADINVQSNNKTRVTTDNLTFGSTTEVNAQTNFVLGDTYFIGSGRHDQTNGNFKAFFKYGTVSADTTLYKTASPSERLTPNDASNKLASGTRSAAILNGTTRTVSVWVRESVVGDGTDYNGNRARLICKTNYGAGVTSDQVLATATVSSEGAWQQLSATTPSVTDNAVLEFYVDCDGTTGWVNVDDWRIS
jgi:hypothetical protein